MTRKGARRRRRVLTLTLTLTLTLALMGAVVIFPTYPIHVSRSPVAAAEWVEWEAQGTRPVQAVVGPSST